MRIFNLDSMITLLFLCDVEAQQLYVGVILYKDDEIVLLHEHFNAEELMIGLSFRGNIFSKQLQQTIKVTLDL